MVDKAIALLANVMHLYTIVDSMVVIIGNNIFHIQCAVLTIENDPHLVKISRRHVDKSPPCIG